MLTTNQIEACGLHPTTRARIAELFRDRSCRRCGAQATRLSAQAYYCHAHFPLRRPPRPATVRVCRVGT